MIEINLLPANMRKATATPLPRLLATFAGLGMVGVLLVVVLNYYLNRIPAKEKELVAKQQELVEKSKKAKELDELDLEILAIKAHVDAVKGLYLKRRVWAKVLYDLNEIISLDKSLQRANQDGKYLWLKKLEYRDAQRQINIDGYGSARKYDDALEIVGEFHKNMLHYRSGRMPNVSKKEMIEKRIAEELTRIKERQKEDPEAPGTSDALGKLNKQLRAIEDVEMGLVAKQRFGSLFDSIQLGRMRWKAAPKPKAKGQAKGGSMPSMAFTFKFSLIFKKPETDDDPFGL